MIRSFGNKKVILAERVTKAPIASAFRASFPDIWFTVFDYIPCFSKEYCEQLSQGARPVIKNNAIFHEDCNLPCVTCKDNTRITHHSPDDPQHTIHMLGPSYLYGHMSRDEETIPSYLQEQCNVKFKNKYVFKNYGVRGLGIGPITLLQLKNIPIKKDDIVILYGRCTDINALLSIYKFSLKKQAKFCVILHPRAYDIINPSNLEQFYIKFGNDAQQYKKWAVKKEAIDGVITCTKYNEPQIMTELKKINIPCFDTQQAVNRPHHQGEIFFDAAHVCAKGNKLIANYIFEHVMPELDKQILPTREEQRELFSSLREPEVWAQAYETFVQQVKRQHKKNSSIHEWLNSIEPFTPDTRNGAIIMNCNPFTKGHLYLIETALKSVDNLYIFVVQEDKSNFLFKDRIGLVKKGTAHLAERIKVLPSGNFIISSITFPEYFEKAHLEENIKVDTSNDVAIFAVILAPRLNISVRFVGEEPNCIVTNQYNQTMLDLLPNLGIQFIEIPRIKHQGTFISASYVRELLENKQDSTILSWSQIKEIVPTSTYEYLLCDFIYSSLNEKKVISFNDILNLLYNGQIDNHDDSIQLDVLQALQSERRALYSEVEDLKTRLHNSTIRNKTQYSKINELLAEKKALFRLWGVNAVVLFNSLRYRILSEITCGRKKQHYRKKKKELKSVLS